MLFCTNVIFVNHSGAQLQKTQFICELAAICDIGTEQASSYFFERN